MRKPRTPKNTKALVNEQVVFSVRHQDEMYRRYSAMTMVWPCIQSWFYDFSAHLYLVPLSTEDRGCVVPMVVKETVIRFKSRPLVDPCDGDRSLLASLAEALTLAAPHLAGSTYLVTTVSGRKVKWKYGDAPLLSIILEEIAMELGGPTPLASIPVPPNLSDTVSVELVSKKEVSDEQVEAVKEQIRSDFLPRFVQEIIQGSAASV